MTRVRCVHLTGAFPLIVGLGHDGHRARGLHALRISGRDHV